MAISSTTNLTEALRELHILERSQEKELDSLPGKFADPRALARELVQRGWLTPFQVNQLFRDQAAGLVLGSYVILERLGEGGMGQVFKARHMQMDRIVALKVIRKERLANPDAVRRFLREIKAASQLSHPNVVMALDAEQVGETQIFVMQYVDGTDLSRLVKQRGPLPVGEACLYIAQAARGLQHAHERGLVHRDIKPSNLLLARGAGSDALVKILDLGLARVMDVGNDLSSLTHEGTVVGTPDYMAPEQSRDSRKADGRADLYSLGCTFHFLLAGQPAFTGLTLAEVVLKHQLDPPPRLEELRPDVPPEVADITRKLMAKRPEDRFQTAAELVEALSPWIGQAGLHLPPVSTQSKSFPQLLLELLPWSAKTTASGSGAVTQDTNDLTYLDFPTAKKRRRKQWLFAGLACGLILLVILGLWSFLKKPPATPGNSSSGLPLASLSKEKIPDSERLANCPELVAVLGERHEPHGGHVLQVAFTPDGKTVLSAAADGSVRSWNAANLRQQQTFSTKGKESRTAAFAPRANRLAIAGDDGNIRMWDLAKPKEPRTIATKSLGVGVLAFSPDGTKLIIAQQVNRGGANPVRVSLLTEPFADLSKGPTIANVPDYSPIAISPNGKYVAVSAFKGGNPNAKVYDISLDKPGLVATKDLKNFDGIKSLVFSPDSKMLAIAHDEGVDLWYVGAQAKARRVEVKNTVSVAFSPDGAYLVCGTGNPGDAFVPGAIHLYEINSGELLLGVGEATTVGALAFSPDSSQICSGTTAGTVNVWDVHNGKIIASKSRGHQGEVNALAFAPDAGTLASGGADQTLRLWDVTGDEAKEKTTIDHLKMAVFGVAFSPNGKKLACCGEAKTSVFLWDLQGDQPPRLPAKLKFDRAWGRDLAFSPDGGLLATGGAVTPDGKKDTQQGAVFLWDATDLKDKEPTVLPGGFKRAMVNSLAFSGDGRYIAAAAAAGQEKSVLLWDVKERKELSAFKDAKSSVGKLAFSPIQPLLAFGADNNVYFWEVGKPPRKAAELIHAGNVLTAAFTPDGRVLASGGKDGLLVLWDPQTGKQRKQWQLPGAVHALAFAPDGKHLAVGNVSGTIYILRLDLQGK